MKRFNNLYDKIKDTKNLRLAIKNASRGKSNYKEVKDINENFDFYLSKLQELLEQETFENGKYVKFKKNEYGKERILSKLPFFPDRILHHAICQVLEPIWFKQYIRNTFACIKNRGIHDGVNIIKKDLKNKNQTKYYLKFDIKQYFPSVDNEILKSIVIKKIKCKKTLNILFKIIDSNGKKGIPIGNYISQNFSNLYLSSFDHYCKENLKLKYYYRYCDDIVVFSNSIFYLKKIFINIKNYLKDNLKLDIKPNIAIAKVENHGLDFLGYRFFHNYTIVRKSLLKRFYKRLDQIKKHKNPLESKNIVSSIYSYYGWFLHSNCSRIKTHLHKNNLKNNNELSIPRI
jgi:RNA-directed DNA polymerase